jgi:hypothetical protein
MTKGRILKASRNIGGRQNGSWRERSSVFADATTLISQNFLAAMLECCEEKDPT